MPLLPGEILNRRYRIVNLLAEGPYGAVYRAYDIKDKVDYAIKEYRDPSPQTQQLFRAEARRLSRLSHGQMPAFRDHFNLENQGQYLVSDYIDGIDLQSLVNQYGTLPSDVIIGWLQAVAKPLEYLHKQGTVHSNLKPANIRVTPSGDVYLVDTGLPGLGISIGTSGYTAPEQANQNAATPASDIYSLGATLYTLLTGKTPPDALHRESGLETLTPAREVNPDVEPYLSIAASRAMDIRPDVRYETVAEFTQALERPIGRATLEYDNLRRTQPKQATPPPPPRFPSKMRRQIEKRAAFSMVALLGAILLIGAGIFFFSDRIQFVTDEPDAATATVQSQIIAALTQLAPTITPTPPPTETPEPTPAPLIDRLTSAQMVFVPGGVFRLGDDDSEEVDEKPSQNIRVDEFFMDVTEVTNGAYEKCVNAGICTPPLNPNATFHPSYYGDPAYSEYPVIFVNWFQADAFCQWRGARLPTEAEWEKAAGYDPTAFVKTIYPWGDDFDGTLANFCDNSCPTADRNPTFDDGSNDTARVASYPEGASPIRIYDMAGNVMEWVADWYAFDTYDDITRINPLGPLEGDAKVIRGGSWLTSSEFLRVTARMQREPTVANAHIGFRCAQTPP